jgi:hypothetical protein
MQLIRRIQKLPFFGIELQFDRLQRITSESLTILGRTDARRDNARLMEQPGQGDLRVWTRHAFSGNLADGVDDDRVLVVVEGLAERRSSAPASVSPWPRL